MTPGKRKRHYDHFRTLTAGSGKNVSRLPRILQSTLNRFSPAELRTRRGRLDKAQKELGLHYAIADNESHNEPSYDLDLAPLVLAAREWDTLSSGVIQRTRAFNAFVEDIYGEQEILRQRAIPYPLVLRDPAFLREVAHLPAVTRAPLLFGAVDLFRNGSGEWTVVENHYALPFGLSYALQHRRILSGAIPELFARFNVHPVAGFSSELIEALRARSERESPRIVLLTDTATGHAFFEESFLARRMGIPTVQPEDLLVRESRVFLRTVGGLEPVDVIYRRIRSTALDPVSLGSTSGKGIPGLLSCLRKGTVQIVNSPGCGIADNKGLMRYSDVIIRYYLHEEPILKTIPAFDCGDPDQADYVWRNLSRMSVKPVQGEELVAHFFRNRLHTPMQKDARVILRNHPEYVAAHPWLRPQALPRFTGRTFSAQPFFLRLFVILGDRPRVLPGGLCFQKTGRGPAAALDTFGGSKDVWVESSPEASARAAKRTSPAPPLYDYHVGSRAAECLYWIGRYTERAENTARMLNVLEMVRWEELGPAGQASYWPLWLAVAAATGQSDHFRRDKPPADTLRFSRKLVFDRNDPASVLLCLRAARNNAQAIREFLTPEVWDVLAALLDAVEKAAPRGRLARDRLRETCQFVVDQSAHLQGKAGRTMARDEGWHFFQMGRMLERGLCTVAVMDRALAEAIAAADDHATENPDLTALLRILSSLDAYRREFRSRAYVDRVAELLWQSTEAPSSVAYCAESLRESLRRILARQPQPPTTAVFDRAETLCSHIRGISCAAAFPWQPDDPEYSKPLESGRLEEMKKRLETENSHLEAGFTSIHQLLEDTYFSHLHLLVNRAMVSPPGAAKAVDTGKTRSRKAAE